MSFLTAADVAELRVVQEATFTDVCTITPDVPASDLAGGYRDTWSGGTDVPCAVVSPSRAAQSGLAILDIGSDERQMVFCLPVGTSCRQGWRIDWQGRTFEATSMEEPGTYDMQLTAIGLERRNGT